MKQQLKIVVPRKCAHVRGNCDGRSRSTPKLTDRISQYTKPDAAVGHMHASLNARWHMHCIVIRDDAWLVLLSPCNTKPDAAVGHMHASLNARWLRECRQLTRMSPVRLGRLRRMRE